MSQCLKLGPVFFKYLIGSLNGYKVIVDLLGFRKHFLRFALFVVLDGEPEIKILIAEFAH